MICCTVPELNEAVYVVLILCMVNINNTVYIGDANSTYV
jgi:hypothetical protein